MSAQPAEPRPSATLVVLRPAGTGVEVLLMRRPAGQDFAQAFVFPGGCVEAQDARLAGLCSGLDDRQASAALGLAADGLTFFAAAIRECFEEAGLLLVRDRRGALFSPGSALEAGRLADYRQLLLAGAMSLEDLCREEGFTLAADRLQYFSYWITPVQVPRRYATRFFAVAAPERQAASPDGREATELRWLCPSRALAQVAEGLDLRPPTRDALARFTAAANVDEALAAARAVAAAGVQAVLPVRPPHG